MFCSKIVHQDAAHGAFATRDYEKGKVIGEYTGALYLAKQGTLFSQFRSQ